MASVGLGMQMVAGLVAAAAVWETSWALPVGTEVVVDWVVGLWGLMTNFGIERVTKHQNNLNPVSHSQSAS